MDEYVVLVNERNEPIGQALKSEVHTRDTPLHRAFSVFVFNPRGELLLQQRSAHKVTWPLVWSNSCCGHPLPGEKTEVAVGRRLYDELGLRVPELWEVLPDFRYRAELDGVVEHEVCPVFVGFTDQRPQPNPDEVAAVCWVVWTDFQREAAATGAAYSPWCIEETRLLARSFLLRRLFREHVS